MDKKHLYDDFAFLYIISHKKCMFKILFLSTYLKGSQNSVAQATPNLRSVGNG